MQLRHDSPPVVRLQCPADLPPLFELTLPGAQFPSVALADFVALRWEHRAAQCRFQQDVRSVLERVEHAPDRTVLAHSENSSSAAAAERLSRRFVVSCLASAVCSVALQPQFGQRSIAVDCTRAQKEQSPETAGRFVSKT